MILTILAEEVAAGVTTGNLLSGGEAAVLPGIDHRGRNLVRANLWLRNILLRDYCVFSWLNCIFIRSKYVFTGDEGIFAGSKVLLNCIYAREHIARSGTAADSQPEKHHCNGHQLKSCPFTHLHDSPPLVHQFAHYRSKVQVPHRSKSSGNQIRQWIAWEPIRRA